MCGGGRRIENRAIPHSIRRLFMLVLSRKYRESVVVGAEDGVHHQLKVTVLEIGNGKVMLGFEVDSEVPVYRLEIWERMCAAGEVGRPGIRTVRPD
jgi:carbon storage regulator CsrA